MVKSQLELERESKRLYKKPFNAPKNSYEVNCFILIAYRENWASNSQLARAFAVTNVTVTCITNLNSRAYIKLHNEFNELGLKAFKAKYYRVDLHNLLNSSIAMDRARAYLRANPGALQLWFDICGQRWEIWEGDDGWFWALHEVNREREYVVGPFETYAAAVHDMRNTEDIDYMTRQMGAKNAR
jgi:hypothetical protein